jgi:hypothetical protein
MLLNPHMSSQSIHEGHEVTVQRLFWKDEADLVTAGRKSPAKMYNSPHRPSQANQLELAFAGINILLRRTKMT